MGELVPSYPQPYRLFNPWTGHPLFSGPNGQPGYSTAQFQSDSWVQPDGVRAWFYDTSTPDPNNRVALGLDVSSPNDPGIGYAGAYAAAQRHGANAAQADLFAAISMAESSAHWSDHNNNAATGDDSIGLWQINLRAHPQYRATNLYNIDANAQAAAEVSNGWTNATPWSTFTSGAYKQYLQGGTAPVGQIVEAPPPAGPTAGPVRRSVDAIIASLPDPSIFGFHPRDLIGDALDPLANAIDAAFALVLAGLGPVRQWVEGAVGNVEQIVAPIVTNVEHELTAALDYGVGAVESVAREGVSLATSALHEAEAVGGAILGEAESFARTAADDVLSLAGTAVHEAEALAKDGLHALAQETEALIVEARGLAAEGIHEAEALAATGLDDLRGLVTTGLHDAEALAAGLVHDAEAAADGALSALERDVIGPLVSEADHWFHDVLGPLGGLLGALDKLGSWIVAAGELLVIGPVDVYDTLHDLAPADIIAAVERTIPTQAA